jgi:hypothetical protein
MSLILILLLLMTKVFGAEFDELMGKNTKHWLHLQNPAELEALKRFKTLYDQHEHLLSEKVEGNKIPKVVHFIWLGPRSFPPESVENVRTWMAQNPDWSFKFWTDRERDPPCHGMERIVLKEYPFPFLKRCYEASENWGEKSDILRYEILFNEGGVYVDHDANCLAPFEKLHAGFDFYGGLETPHPPFAGLNLTMGNGVIGSRPGHPISKRVIDLIGLRWDELAHKYPAKDGYSRTQIVIERTYIALTDAIQETVNLAGNTDIVLPAAYFFAKKGVKPLYSQHFFANSWAKTEGISDEVIKSTHTGLSKLDKKVQKLFIFGGFILFLNLLLIGFWIIWIRKGKIV